MTNVNISGILSVAIYSDVDRESPFVKEAGMVISVSVIVSFFSSKNIILLSSEYYCAFFACSSILNFCEIFLMILFCGCFVVVCLLFNCCIDEAICIGGSTPSESYLRADRIIAAAKQTKADAIHPGTI